MINQTNNSTNLFDAELPASVISDDSHVTGAQSLTHLPEDVPSTKIRRRSFLGLTVGGVTSMALCSISAMAGIIETKVKRSSLLRMVTGIERSYWDRTDKFEIKKELIRSAWERKDFRQVRALANSIRISSLQARIEEGPLDTPVSGSSDFHEVSALSPEWQKFAKGWKYYKVLSTEEKSGFARELEPVEAFLGFPGDKVKFLSREVRVAKIEAGKLSEIKSQVFEESTRGNDRFCKVIFLSGAKANEKQFYLIFFGNDNAQLPAYKSDLTTSGEGYRLEIENNFYKANLSPQAGKIERLTIKRNHGLVLYPGGVGHGEPGNIDWSNDYMAEGGFQKFRIALWDESPDYEVVRGPVCTIVRCWGFPYSPLHPVFSPARLNIDVEYRFYAGLPYFHKFSRMSAVKTFNVGAIRDDEWVLPGKSLPEVLWIGPDGKLNTGAVPPAFSEKLWGVGFFNKDTSDSFMALHLEHTGQGVDVLHTGVPRTETTKFHGQVWARYPYRSGPMKEGSAIFSKSAYVSLPFTSEEGPGKVERLRNELKAPVTLKAGILPKNQVVARSQPVLAKTGESGDSPVSKELLWKALHHCKDPQFYSSDISIVELGYVYDVTVQGDTVNIVLCMPHRGRPLGAYFTHGSSSVQQGPGTGKASLTIPEALMKVPGVKNVTLTQTWIPMWNSGFITGEGRRKLEL